MTNPYSHINYNWDIPNNVIITGKDYKYVTEVMSRDDINLINTIAAGIANSLNQNIPLYTVLTVTANLCGGEVFDSGGNNPLYGKIINPHIWISVSDESYVIFYHQKAIDSIPWSDTMGGLDVAFTEYYL